ncbi:hypothetical protein Tco_1127260 [Tanacetum coccineum]
MGRNEVVSLRTPRTRASGLQDLVSLASLMLLRPDQLRMPFDREKEDGRKRIFKKRTKNKAKNDKTEHGMEKCEKTKPNPSQKVNRKVK